MLEKWSRYEEDKKLLDDYKLFYEGKIKISPFIISKGSAYNQLKKALKLVSEVESEIKTNPWKKLEYQSNLIK
ncbi:hypothetical protein TRFO_41061 [Tritrichomonas foetus]|uniref:Uncharacterized protein n=1 Tax=Tritrichomonas foetus TaxID=1144522 RepID=A0A1J4L2P8_9EUKA|nr:hypothetical protein TRFO_41061 [Tritrichomonas foetus]|eukprot:OHT17368.1 hypothetical protein TRFO_41061 [Tritrichomonas foetus]